MGEHVSVALIPGGQPAKEQDMRARHQRRPLRERDGRAHAPACQGLGAAVVEPVVGFALVLPGQGHQEHPLVIAHQVHHGHAGYRRPGCQPREHSGRIRAAVNEIPHMDQQRPAGRALAEIPGDRLVQCLELRQMPMHVADGIDPAPRRQAGKIGRPRTHAEDGGEIR